MTDKVLAGVGIDPFHKMKQDNGQCGNASQSVEDFEMLLCLQRSRGGGFVCVQLSDMEKYLQFSLHAPIFQAGGQKSDVNRAMVPHNSIACALGF